jgi:hypothetical protein
VAKAPAEIRSLARSHTQTAINTLVGIMEQEAAPHAARVSAAQAILDRGWGKPAQAIVGGDEDDNPVKIETIRRIIVKPGHSDSGGVPPAAVPGPV